MRNAFELVGEWFIRFQGSVFRGSSFSVSHKRVDDQVPGTFQRLNAHGPWTIALLAPWKWAGHQCWQRERECMLWTLIKFKGNIISLVTCLKQDPWISINMYMYVYVCICMLSICENVMKSIQIMGKLCMYVYAHEYHFRYWYKSYKRMCNLDKCWHWCAGHF